MYVLSTPVDLPTSKPYVLREMQGDLSHVFYAVAQFHRWSDMFLWPSLPTVFNLLMQLSFNFGPPCNLFPWPQSLFLPSLLDLFIYIGHLFICVVLLDRYPPPFFFFLTGQGISTRHRCKSCEGHCTQTNDNWKGRGKSPLGFLSKVVPCTMLVARVTTRLP